MIIVEGWLRVAPEQRAAYLDESCSVIELARQAKGCLAFHLSADLLDPSRINVLERWTDAEAVTAFRGSGPSDSQVAAIVAADVREYTVTNERSL